MNKVIHGDCLIESEQIESGSVDLILTDPPYGNMDTDGGKRLGINGWDVPISPTIIYNVANRVLRKNGKMILFSQEPYTTKLINEAIPNLPFSYRGIWEKDTFGNSLGVNRNWVGFFEDILVFSKTHDHEALHPLRLYFKDVMDFIGLNLKQINNKLGHRRAEHTFYIDSTQYGLCTESTYTELIDVFGIDSMQGFKPFAELKPIDTEYRESLIKEMTEAYPSTFNLWEGKKYKSNILKYAKDYNGYHPTQKPVLLLEDLIQTFSNENDLVVDLTAGSGSTAIACINTKRRYLVIEKEQKYIDITNRRIMEHESQLTITL